jgi:hypothetical protein
MSTWTHPRPGDLIEEIRYAGTQVRCPRCHHWGDALLVLEAEGRPAEALLLCEGCTTRARARGAGR